MATEPVGSVGVVPAPPTLRFSWREQFWRLATGALVGILVA